MVVRAVNSYARKHKVGMGPSIRNMSRLYLSTVSESVSDPHATLNAQRKMLVQVRERLVQVWPCTSAPSPSF